MRSFLDIANCHNTRTKQCALAIVFLTALAAGCGNPRQADLSVMGHVSGSLVALSTPDVSAATRWYQEKLGFQLVKEGQMKKGLHFALLRYDDNIVELIQNPAARPLREAVPGVQDPFEIHGIFKIGFTVRDLNDVFADLQRRGAKVDFNLTPLNDLRLRAFGIRDVDGNLIQFFGK